MSEPLEDPFAAEDDEIDEDYNPFTSETIPTLSAVRREAEIIANTDTVVYYDSEVAKTKYIILLIAQRTGLSLKREIKHFLKKQCKLTTDGLQGPDGKPFSSDQLRECVKKADVGFKAIKKQIRDEQEQIKSTPDCVPEIHNKAMKILREKVKFFDESGKIVDPPDDIMEFFLREFRKRHSGNEKSMKIMLMAALCPHVEASQGIFPKASGDKGSGKSTGFYTAALLIHQKYVLMVSCTPKALFYEPIPAGCIIVLDDNNPADDMIDMFKRKMSVDYHKESVHLTVIDGASAKKTMPPGVVPVFTSVTDSKSDQLLDRQTVIALEKNSELDDQYTEFLKELAEKGFIALRETDEVLICREITRILKERQYNATVPFAKRIEFAKSAKANRRSMNTFFDLIRCHAVLYQYRRQTDANGNIIATTDDFAFAVEMMDTGETRFSIKMTKAEESIWRLIKEHNNDHHGNGITQKEIAKKKSVSKGRISQILHGETKKNSGLADKAPLMSEEIYDKDSGIRSIHWTTTGVLEENVAFATLKPE